MTVEEILAALQSIMDEAETAGGDLTDEQVQRYEDLEGQLKTRRSTEEVRKRHEAYKSTTTRPR